MHAHMKCGSSFWNSTCSFFCVSLLSLPAFAQAGTCALEDTVLTCTGDFPDGIVIAVLPGSPVVNTLNVNGITSDIDVSDQSGVALINYMGGQVTINAGALNDTFLANTAGDNASGIFASSVGAPGAYSWVQPLGIWIPDGPGGSGGAVTVNNFSDVVTAGDGAHGIIAMNQVGSYDPVVRASLEAFNPETVTYEVISVNGSVDNIGAAIAGTNGGTFTILGDGSYTFDPGTDFDGLVLDPGDEVVTEAGYFVNANGQGFASAVIRVVYFMDDINKDDPDADPEYVLTSRTEIRFPDYNMDGLGGGGDAGSLFPDAGGYVDTLLADAGVAGSSEAISVLNAGTITTNGTGSNGIYAQTISGTGRHGHDSCFFCSEPTAGGTGANGGTIEVVNDGEIDTTGSSSAGIFVLSRGGTGGYGGNGGTWWYGRAGGKGGRGGDLFISGDGGIHTLGNQAPGVFATSEGGVGGHGGGSDFATGGGAGGAGGNAGTVSIDSAMDITTEGLLSHAIWARSIGGGGGVGGSAGWLGTASSGSGGNASDGGIVDILSRGELVTLGDFSYGIYGQSVGGFGGAGGSAAGLFVSWGGHGASAGSGGGVTIVNDETGSIHTEGIYSHGIFGQSIGGGGGSGGSAAALVGLGGGAGAGGHGGTVNIGNAGSIETLGNIARGIYAQSIGGGGGDGGDSGGLVSIGGSGSVASHGGTVNVSNTGSITTSGIFAEGVFMQSIGGGGGNGGESSGLVSIGGDGAGGGDGGDISFLNTGAIDTSGVASTGVFIQSIGGGGGNGSTSVGGVSIGGTGSGGGIGGDITIDNGGRISTTSDLSDGLFIQSIGGGGGNSGSTFAAYVSLGGDGGGGGDAGTITLTNDGGIETLGLFSRGIFSQSIGGGGGNGNASGGFFASLGGDGGIAGDGGIVAIINSGKILTSNIGSQGIFVQSIGGGGGNGGASGAIITGIGGDGAAAGDGGDVSVENSGLIGTDGFASQAVFAQSIGGGGGNGAGAGAFAVAIGGDGAAAGDGGGVTIDNDGELSTDEDFSIGVFAQSIGGGGGNGAGTGAWFASIGGDGGASGSGGLVTVINAGKIITAGDWSHSVLAQSIGGGGGNGSGSGAGWVAIGGDGARGSHGGDVSVTNSGDLLTSGIGAQGIHAESIGGGGGTGAGAGALLAGVGGAGGGASNGGDLAVTNTGIIQTRGDLAHSIYAVSIGGGGGSADTAGAMFLSLGGDGNSGGDGGLVTVNNASQLATFGNIASGIFAQSVGGGGGNGGGAISVSVVPNISIGVAVGGDGGEGGIGQLITVNNEGSIFTAGDGSHGIFAQSVGGGGGSGGNAFSFSASAPLIEEIPITINAAVSIGGNGENGGAGGTVDINHSGDIVTEGFRSYGIMAQSVGGGGGDGGNATSITLSVNADVSGTVAIGGKGDGGGDGGIVDVDSSGVIMTSGAHAAAIMAQSIGGGGGAGGDATTVSIDLGFPMSPEDLVPTPSMSFNVAIGGSGAGGGDGGEVIVNSEDTIFTEGIFAAGIMAQSIGGGGGTGGDARSIQVDLSANPADFVPYLDAIEFESTLVFGGNGGRGGDGGVVAVTNNADVDTSGDFAYGVVAQSVGGGGGSGGNALTFSFDNTELLPIPEIPVLDDIADLSNLSMVLRGGGGAAGNGGNVAFTNSSTIRTAGDFAHGIVAQSIAGGGGLAGISNAQGATTTLLGDFALGVLSQIDGSGVAFAGSVGGSGTAGNVVITNTGDIATSGDSAFGIFAQSAAGQGRAGTVRLTTSGNISTSGLDAAAIFAQSVGGSGSGDITLDILDGSIVGGTGSGAGVRISGGNNNAISNEGSISSIPGVDGNAIIAEFGNDAVENFGTVTGDVDLGFGANSFDNFGWLNTGAMFLVGEGNRMLNAGFLSPGGAMNLYSTDFTGNFVQTSAGTMIVDLQFDYGMDTADYLGITGSADLDGTLALNLIDAGRIMPGAYSLGLVSATNGITDTGIELEVAPSAVVSYELVPLTPTEFGLNYNVSFAPVGLDRNYMAIGKHINEIQLAGGCALMEPLAAVIAAQPDQDALTAVYARLSPNGYWANQAARVFSSLSFDSSMHSCPVRDGDFRFSREGECGWTSFVDREVDHAAGNGTLASSEHAQILNAGLQRALTGHWHGAIAFSFENSDLTIPGYTRRDGTEFNLGGIAKGRYGPHDVTFSLGFGRGTFDTLRYVNLPTPDVTADGERHFTTFAMHTRYGYNVVRNTAYLRPTLDLGYTQVDADSFEETGGGGARLIVDSQKDDYFTARAALQIGGEWTARGGVLLRPYARAGLTRFLSGTTPDISATLSAAPGVVHPFTQWNKIDDTFTDVSAGFDVLWENGMVLRIGYEGQYASTWDAESFWAKFLFDM